MKSLVFLIALLLTSYWSYAQKSLAQHLLDSVTAANPRIVDPGLLKLDLKYGFRDLRFETPLARVKNAVAFSPAGGLRMYRRTGESKKIGTASASDIQYAFYKGRLAGVCIMTKGYGNSQAILKAFQALYGEGKKENPAVEKYIWGAEKTLMTYEQNSVTNDAMIYMYSFPVMDAKAADEAKAAEDAGSDL